MYRGLQVPYIDIRGHRDRLLGSVKSNTRTFKYTFIRRPMQR